jgi:hypothetical protein
VISRRAGVALLLAALVVVVAAPFVTATTFVGDDHVFFAFARYAAGPLVPFVRDQHGGEYYRPLPMAIWWCLGRLSTRWLGGGSAPFAALAFALHAGAAIALAAMLRAAGRAVPIAAGAAVLFFIAPQNLEAAYWFAASTDLLATLFVLLSLTALLCERPIAAAAAALAAYLSKESAYVLPLLALLVVRPPRARRLAPTVLPLLLAVASRVLVLRRWGGGGDERAGALGHALQVVSGVVHVFTATGVLPEVLAWSVGSAVVALLLWVGARRTGRDRTSLTPLAFAVVALAPLAAASWVVGARYFYLPAVGLAWASAEALAEASPAARLTVAAVVLLLGGIQAAARANQVASYDRRVAAARRAVAAGVRAGHRLFHVDGGIKDLDLAVKEDRALSAFARDILVLGDVPASFAIVPPAMMPAASVFVAAPPLPPSGGYRFCGVTVVGLARRGDEPSLEEALERFPDLRFIRLRPLPGGQIIGRDATEEVETGLELPAAAGRQP